jgi:hypothetical protein
MDIMPLTFNQAHITSLLAPQLAPNERILFKARGVEKPWYSRIFVRFGALFWRNYLVAATDSRILFVQHGGLLSGYAAKKVDALAWHEIDRTKLGWGIFNKDLSVKAGARGFNKTVVLGRFWMKDNFASAEGMVQQWTASRGALPGGAAPMALPRARA